MDVGKVLKPGDAGTKRIHQTFGDKLICVRYRYDKAQRKRITTAEIIIDEKPWIYSPYRPAEISPTPEQASTRLVLIKIDYSELELRQIAKFHGAKWRPEYKAWEIDKQQALKLGLEQRIVNPDNGTEI